jgi:hypothetical protein
LIAVIDRPAQAVALLKPVRARILEHLRAPDSATGVAAALGLPRQRVGARRPLLQRQLRPRRLRRRMTPARITRPGPDAGIVRLDYDRAQAERDFYDTGFLDEAASFARLVHVELRTARSLIYDWTRRYEARVLEGKLTAEEAVEDYLN